MIELEASMAGVLPARLTAAVLLMSPESFLSASSRVVALLFSSYLFCIVFEWIV
jgi:hypothetical protein